MAKEQGTKPIAQNKKARHDYAIEDKYEAGLVLTGTEVKSLREGRASLAESFITIDRRGEMWLESQHSRISQRHVEQPRTQTQAQAAAACGADRQAGPPNPGQGIHHHSAEPVFQRRPRQGRDRARPRQKEFDKRQSLREEQDKREALRAMRYANKQVR